MASNLSDKTVVRKKPYSMTRERKVWQKIQNMFEAGIIRPSVSAFASPITIAPKEGGNFRLCTDYRVLYNQTEIIRFPMPRIEAIIDEAGGCRYFSRLDLCKKFWQVPLEEKTKMYAAFTTLIDLYEYNRVPFVWKNSPAWFQKFENQALQPYHEIFCAVYMDNIIIYSKTEMEHRQLSQVFIALSSAKLKVDFNKSEFFQNKIVFLVGFLTALQSVQKKSPWHEYHSF